MRRRQPDFADCSNTRWRPRLRPVQRAQEAVFAASCGRPEIGLDVQANTQAARSVLAFGLQSERVHGVRVTRALQTVHELNNVCVIARYEGVQLDFRKIAASEFLVMEGQIF